MVADHIEPMVVEHYRTGSINLQRMRTKVAVEPQCPTCSRSQGGRLSAWSRKMKKIVQERGVKK
jgi:hypothetical protein